MPAMPRFTLVATKAAPTPGSPAMGPSAALGATSNPPALGDVDHGKEWAGDLYEDTSAPPSDPTAAYASYTGSNGEQGWLDRAADGTLTGWVRTGDGSTYRYPDVDAWAVDVDDAGMTYAGGTAPPPAAMDPAADPAADPNAAPTADPAAEGAVPAEGEWEPETDPAVTQAPGGDLEWPDPDEVAEATETAEATPDPADAEAGEDDEQPADGETPDEETETEPADDTAAATGDDEPDLWSFVAGDDDETADAKPADDEDDDEPEKRPARKR